MNRLASASCAIDHQSQSVADALDELASVELDFAARLRERGSRFNVYAAQAQAVAFTATTAAQNVRSANGRLHELR